jgi:hypothetical protein
MEDMRGPDDKGAVVVLELNVIDECREVEQETRCHMLLVGWWVNPERLGRWRQHIGLRASMGTQVSVVGYGYDI